MTGVARKKKAVGWIDAKIYFRTSRCEFDRKSSLTTPTHHKTSDNTMASALKRKRGTVGVKDIPKRAKPFNDSQESTGASKLLNQTGWDAAFNPPTKPKELVHTNGINADGVDSQRNSNSPEAADFEDFINEGTSWLAERAKGKSQAKQEAKIAWLGSSAWKLSEPIGGRMIAVDPVFTEDERYAAVFLP